MEDQLKDKPKDIIKDLAKAVGCLAIIGVVCIGLVALFLLFAEDRAKPMMCYFLVNNTNQNLPVYNYEPYRRSDIPMITSKKIAKELAPLPYPLKNLAPGDTFSFYVEPTKLDKEEIIIKNITLPFDSISLRYKFTNFNISVKDTSKYTQSGFNFYRHIKKEEVKDDHIPEYWFGTTPPKFNDDIHKFLESKINYPQDAIDSDIQGTVYLTFVIGKDGEVSNVKILRGVYPSIDSEAVRVVRLMPKWDMKEIKLDTNYAGVRMTVPINFVLKQ